jgi:TolA-binding protein
MMNHGLLKTPSYRNITETKDTTTMSIQEEDFTRVFTLVSSLAELTAKNTSDISRTEDSVQRLVSVTTAHQQTLELYQESFQAVIERIDRNSEQIQQMQVDLREMQVDIREMQSEVRGLQTENRRILDQLINRDDNQE